VGFLGQGGVVVFAGGLGVEAEVEPPLYESRTDPDARFAKD
jgi:hypothetical protein